MVYLPNICIIVIGPYVLSYQQSFR